MVYIDSDLEQLQNIVPDSTCAHIFKERDMCRNKLTQVAGYSAVKLPILEKTNWHLNYVPMLRKNVKKNSQSTP